MALTNRERIGKGLELLSDGLRPYLERECQAHFGDGWQEKVKNPKAKGHSLADPQVLLGIMTDNWNNVFRDSLGQAERSLVSELREARNDWAHNKDFSSDDAVRHLDSMQRLLTAVSAAEEAKQVGTMRMDLLRNLFDKARNNEMRKKAYQPTEGSPAAGLKPWREVVTPHPDVASGRYQQAEFAADLWQVYQGEGSSEYRDPTEFFRRTFLTEGLRRLLVQAIRRMNGDGGDPVVELQTNFGGGKTHSMLALYHLFSGAAASDLPGVDELMGEEGLTLPPGVRRSVFVGTQISPGKPSVKPDGTTVRTIWGEIAWQLGESKGGKGKEAFKMVEEDDRNATNPGATLTKLFSKYGPCLILIDEWIAYARQLHTNADLPAGSFDTQFTFAQALTEAAKAAKNTLVVMSIPASESPHQKPERGATHIEIGGEKGFEALERLKNAIGRVEASWRPASPDEGFEIVRRRLFEPLTHDQAKLRDTVARAFIEYYSQQRQEFPSECPEAEYERRIQMAYPIHPELFDRLYNDWSTLEKFQRTRGVLRLMATVIHALWERQDSNLLILPGAMPIDHSAVQFELTRYMPDQWAPVIEKDVDGPNSLPLALDRETPNLGRFSACRRVARTIYMGSAPIPNAANRGVDEKHVKLGCVQPGETVATFGDAIRRLTDRGTYLYVDGSRYWFSTQPTVNRLADDRGSQYSDDDVEEEIKQRLKAEARSRGDFRRVHACVSSADIPDERESALVILGPEYPHRAKQQDTPAQQEAAAILDTRGSSPRNYKNSLVFLAPDANRLRDLCDAVRQWKAWDSICADRDTLNLDPFQTRQAESKRKSADETVAARIPETFQWLLMPAHRADDPKSPIDWQESKLGNGGDSLAKRAIKKLTTDEHFFPILGSERLRHELDRVPLWRGDHVPLRQLCEDFARYLYLPRLQDENVLLDSISDGVGRLTWREEAFAYAERFDETTKRYIGLKAGQGVRAVPDGASVIVKADVAARQLEEDAARAAAAAGVSGRGQVVPGSTATPAATGGGPVTPATENGAAPQPAKKELKRFHGSAPLDPIRLGRDASRIAEEVVQHLSRIVGSDVRVTLEIEAELPEGATEKLVRDVTENCRTLKFETYGFEESE